MVLRELDIAMCNLLLIICAIGVTLCGASETTLPCTISNERSLFSQFRDFVQNIEQYEKLDSIDKFKIDYESFVNNNLSKEACQAIYESKNLSDFYISDITKPSYYYKYLCLKGGDSTTLDNLTNDHRAFAMTWSFLRHVLDQEAIKTHKKYQEIKDFTTNLENSFTLRSKELESQENKRKLAYRDQMKQLYAEFIQEQKYYTVLEEKLFFAKKHLESAGIQEPNLGEQARVKMEYPKEKAALHPWYTKLRFIGWLFKRPITEQFLILKMQYRYIKYKEELNQHKTNCLENYDSVSRERYLSYFQDKLDTVKPMRVWYTWIYKLFWADKHAKYESKLQKYKVYFDLSRKKHNELIIADGTKS